MHINPMARLPTALLCGELIYERQRTLHRVMFVFHNAEQTRGTDSGGEYYRCCGVRILLNGNDRRRVLGSKLEAITADLFFSNRFMLLIAPLDHK